MTEADANAHAAAKLLALAAGASSPAAREQFILLAALYEKLANNTQRLSDTYLPMDLSAEYPEDGHTSGR
jgi:hypothetical protein